MDGHGTARQAGSPAHRFNLQTEILNADRVVAIHRALELQREDEIQIPAATQHKRAARLRRPYLKTAVGISPVVLPRKNICPLPRPGPFPAQVFPRAPPPRGRSCVTASPPPPPRGGESP